jgi:hypothetical protein
MKISPPGPKTVTDEPSFLAGKMAVMFFPKKDSPVKFYFTMGD